MCCSVLQCDAVHCRVMQCHAVWRSVMQCVAAYCTVLQRIALCCSVLKCDAVCCSVMQCDAVYWSVYALLLQRHEWASIHASRSRASFPVLISYIQNLSFLGLNQPRHRWMSRVTPAVHVLVSTVCHEPLQRQNWYATRVVLLATHFTNHRNQEKQ